MSEAPTILLLTVIGSALASGLAMWFWGQPPPALANDDRSVRFRLFLVWGPFGFAGLFAAELLGRLVPAWFGPDLTYVLGVGWFALCVLIWWATPAAIPHHLVPRWYPDRPSRESADSPAGRSPSDQGRHPRRRGRRNRGA